MGKNAKIVATKFSPLFHLQCYRQVASNFTFFKLQTSRFFRLLCQTTIIRMPSLNQYDKITCENCGTQITKINRARYKKSCSAGTLYCTQCPNFSRKSQDDLNYQNAKKHSAPKLDVTFKCKLC